MKKNLKAFTLSETLIVVVVLGIIATLTIPALVNKNKESVARTKVRKAMAAYESALNKMIIENDLKSNTALNEWAGATANCGNPSNYFKKVQGDGCIFKTSDGIWWNISNIERPLIAFKEGDLTSAKANDANDKTAFVLVGRFGNDGSLRVDDLAYETANSVDDTYGNASKAQVEKLYSLLGLKSTGSSGGGGNQSPFAACNGADTCTITYNCPSIDEPNRTCTMDYEKITLTARTENYCYNILNEEETAFEEDCSNLSISTEGNYWIAIEGYPDNYKNQVYTSDGSTCTVCEYDYYNAAKQHCELSGGSLANIAQLKSLANQGKFTEGSWFWALEESFSDGSGAFIVDFAGDADGSNTKDFSETQVLCIGNE